MLHPKSRNRAASKAVPANYGRYASKRVTHKNKERTGVLPDRKYHVNKTPNNSGFHSECALCKKEGINERKWKMHTSINCFGNSSNQGSFNEGLVEKLGNRADDINQYQKSENNYRREMKALNKQNKIHFSMSKHSGSCCNFKNIKKICAKVSKKHGYSSSNITNSEYNSSLYSDSE